MKNNNVYCKNAKSFKFDCEANLKQNTKFKKLKGIKNE